MKILSANLWGKYGPYYQRWEYATKHIPRLGADLYCLQEATDLDLLNRLAKALRASIIISDTDSTGLAILSRTDVAESWMTDYHTRSSLEPYTRKFQAAVINSKKGPFIVTNTHLAWKPGDDTTRHSQVKELLGMITQQDQPTLACGDFNSEFQSHPLEPLRKAGFKDLLEGTPDQQKPTWDNANPFIQSHTIKFPDRRIDLVLANPAYLELYPVQKAAITLREPNREGLHVSDHYGVLVEF